MTATRPFEHGHTGAAHCRGPWEACAWRVHAQACTQACSLGLQLPPRGLARSTEQQVACVCTRVCSPAPRRDREGQLQQVPRGCQGWGAQSLFNKRHHFKSTLPHAQTSATHPSAAGHKSEASPSQKPFHLGTLHHKPSSELTSSLLLLGAVPEPGSLYGQGFS